MMNTQPYSITESLLSRFPRFAASTDTTEEHYIIVSNFAFYVVDGIEAGSFTNGEIDNIFQFMNELGSSDCIDIQNLLVVGIFEKLVDTNKCIDIARQRLSGKALDLFERVLAGWPSPWRSKVRPQKGRC